MTDVFDNTILCAKCNIKMKPAQVLRNGFVLRLVECPKCANKIVHPKDEDEYKNFLELRKKQFNVKMRFVGNSYAVSIPREIVDFMKEQEKIMDDMVNLCFEEFGRISINFHNHDIEGSENTSNGNNHSNKLAKFKEE
ncbi:MAG: hypothetical protein ACP5OG_02845 [Candidatus Nanoarchaeia archaeon]